MIEIKNKEKCCGCGACAQKCPKNCIQMKSDEEGFAYPVVNESFCIHCGLCDSVCPILNKCECTSVTTGAKAYAAYSKNDEELFNSSSGGIFSLLAKTVLDNNGVVFGAAYCDGHEIKHIAITNIEEIYKLRGSKYVQSDIQDSFCRIKKLLKNDIKVLFSGTPCQIEGLLCFLGKEYKNLITVDFVCSGVPSPMLWKDYLLYREIKADSRISNINLRYKKYGWQEYIVRFVFENRKQYTKTRFEDPYMRAFRSGYSLRPSCYECQFKKSKRLSDITVADFWGIEKAAPEMNNHIGTSMVFVNSQKGRLLFSEIFENIKCAEVERETAIACNPMMIKSLDRPSFRDDFFQYVSDKSFVKAVNHYCKIPTKLMLKLKADSIYLYFKERRQQCKR